MSAFRVLAASIVLAVSLAPSTAGANPCPAGAIADEPSTSRGLFHMSFDMLPHAEWMQLEGPMTVCRGMPMLTGEPDRHTGDAPAIVPIEIIQMELVSVNPIAPGFYSSLFGATVIEDPMRPSTGQVVGVFNVFMNTFRAQGPSFFDVFFLVCPESLPLGPASCWRSQGPYRVQTTLHGSLPPGVDQPPYQHANGDPMGLLHAVQMMQAKADSGCHKPFFGASGTDGCVLPDGPSEGGVYHLPLRLIVGNVSTTPATITEVTTASVSPCATLSTWMLDDPTLDLWGADVTVAGPCSLDVEVDIEFSDGTMRTRTLSIEVAP